MLTLQLVLVVALLEFVSVSLLVVVQERQLLVFALDHQISNAAQIIPVQHLPEVEHANRLVLAQELHFLVTVMVPQMFNVVFHHLQQLALHHMVAELVNL